VLSQVLSSPDVDGRRTRGEEGSEISSRLVVLRIERTVSQSVGKKAWRLDQELNSWNRDQGSRSRRCLEEEKGKG